MSDNFAIDGGGRQRAGTARVAQEEISGDVAGWIYAAFAGVRADCSLLIV
jgi:hypothetical protein